MAKQQAKRGPGRPPLENKPTLQDMHLSLPKWLIDRIDEVKRQGESRKGYLLRVLLERPEISEREVGK